MTLPYPPPYQDLKTVAAHTCMGERTIERLVADGHFPAPRKNKCGKLIWVWKEVERWMDAPDNDAPEAGGSMDAEVRRLTRAR